MNLLPPFPHISIGQHTSAYVSIRQHTPAYVSIACLIAGLAEWVILQHTSAYVSIREHRSADVSRACLIAGFAGWVILPRAGTIAESVGHFWRDSHLQDSAGAEGRSDPQVALRMRVAAAARTHALAVARIRRAVCVMYMYV